MTLDSRTIQISLAKVLNGNGGFTEESALNQTAQERMLSDKVLGRIGDAEITRSIYRELGHMCDKRQVEKEPRDRFGQVKYRLNEHGRIHYFGTIQERWLEFWGVNGFAIVLVLVNLIITLLSILFRK